MIKNKAIIESYTSPNYERLKEEMSLIVERINEDQASHDDILFLKEKLKTVSRAISLTDKYLANKFKFARISIQNLNNSESEEDIWWNYINTNKDRIDLEAVYKQLLTTKPKLSQRRIIIMKWINILTFNSWNRYSASMHHISLPPNFKADGKFSLDLSYADTFIAMEIVKTIIS